MARGSAVIEYRGKRGITWRIKFYDVTGKQVMESLDPAKAPRGGWNRKEAERVLGARLAEIKKTGGGNPTR